MNAKHIDWHNLRVFLEVARGGSLSAASSVLDIDPSTVHRRISALEIELATRLFDRSQQGYALTSAGEELLGRVVKMEGEALGIQRDVVGREQQLQGNVRLSTVDDLAFSLLPDIVHDFRRLHPRVCVHIDVRSELADLDRLEADIAIRFGERAMSTRMVSRRIADAATFLYASPAYLASATRPRTPRDLAGHDIVRGGERMARLDMERFMDKHADPARIAFRSDSMLSRLAALRSGMGIGFLGAFIAEADPLLERIDLSPPMSKESVWMLIHVDIRRNARIRAFADFTYDRLVLNRDRFDPV